MSVILSLLAIYFGMAVSLYLYAVVKNFEFMDRWSFKIENSFVGVIPVPRFFLFWLERLMTKK
jgi:hypothetical protein